jgi:hypothetical protein
MHNICGFETALPVISEQLLMFFVTHCVVNLGLAYSTIKLYLAGIRNLYVTQGLPNPLVNALGQPLLQLGQVLRGIKKSQVNNVRPRLPITSDIVQKICNVLHDGMFGSYVDCLLEAVCTIAFFGFLRCGEFTCRSTQFDPRINLTCDDVDIGVFHDGTKKVTLTLKASKTDPFRLGCNIQFYATNQSLCPVASLEKFLEMRGSRPTSGQDPLFLLPEGPLTRDKFINMLRLILDRLGYNSRMFCGHSFRRGACTSATVAQIPDHLIKTLGRWSSDCYQTYISTSQKLILDAQRSMARVSPC